MSIENSTINMANRPEKSKKGAKSQEELRQVFSERLQGLSGKAKRNLDRYDQMLQDGSFDDQDGEISGAGEARKEKMQAELTFGVEKLEKMKATLDSGEDMPQSVPAISVHYAYKDETGKDTTEIISLDIEQCLNDLISFYQKTNLDFPSDFAETVHEIWERNQNEIEQAIEQNGFNGLLIVPANIPLPELTEKMKMGNGYGDYIDSGGSTVSQLPGTSISSQNVDKPRLILYHKATLPEIHKKNGLDVHLNITAQDAEALYQQNPDHYLNTLEDALMLERKHFEETGEHLSDYTKNSAQWLSGTKSGTRFVCSYWNPASGKLSVSALDPGDSHSAIGCRPSRYFF